MHDRARATWGALLALLLTGVWGCGSTNDRAAPPSARTDVFVPNYAPSVRLYHWTTFPIKVALVDVTSGQPVAAARSGAEAWQPFVGDRVATTWTSVPGDAHITVRFANLASAPGPGQAAGTTHAVYYDSGELVSASITVNLWPDMPDVVEAIAAHEMGHALGIYGHSGSNSDLMYPVLNGRSTPSESDVNTLKTDYAWLFLPDAGRSWTPPRGRLHTITIDCGAQGCRRTTGP